MGRYPAHVRAAPLLLLLLLLAACAAGSGHPVRTSLPRIDPADGPVSTPDVPDVALVPEGDAALALLVAGLEKLEPRLREVRERATDGVRPAFVRLTRIERSVLQRYRRVEGANVNQVAVIGTAGRMPLPPEAAARLFLDPEVERQVLAARRFEHAATVFQTERHRRDVYRVEKLRVGAGPFRYDLRFATAVERLDLDDGRIAVRYDPVVWRATTGVSLYRGLLLIEPDGDGSRVTEIVVFGTPLTAPAPFDQILKNLVYDTFQHRGTNLWKRAYDA
jgi:hypothetical protein